jgi:hypothetical protein
LGKDGVSDGSNSVHPIGRPIKNSNCSGVISRPPKASTNRRQLGHFCIDGATKFALRVGVCNKPPTVSLMVRPKISSRYTAIVRWVAEAFETSSRVGDCLFLDVLGDDESGPDAIDEPLHFGPEINGRSPSSRRGAEGLAGEAAANSIDPTEAGKLSNVGVTGDLRPVACEHSPTEGVDLAKSDSSHPGSLETESEGADPGKEVEDIQFWPPLLQCGRVMESASFSLTTSPSLSVFLAAARGRPA